MTTADKLRAIPDLAAQAYTSRDTPHRTPGKRSGKLTGSPIPAVVACWDMMRDDEHGLMQELIEACEAIRGDMEQPPDLPASTWVAVCSDLLGLSDWWQSDDLLHDWVSSSVAHVHSSLSRWVGGPRPARLTCTKCAGRLAVERASDDPNDPAVLVCGDCGHVWHAATVAHEATIRTPMSLPEIAERLDVDLRRIQRWAEPDQHGRSLIAPVTNHEPSSHQPNLYMLGDVERIVAMTRAERIAAKTRAPERLDVV